MRLRPLTLICFWLNFAIHLKYIDGGKPCLPPNAIAKDDRAKNCCDMEPIPDQAGHLLCQCYKNETSDTSEECQTKCKQTILCSMTYFKKAAKLCSLFKNIVYQKRNSSDPTTNGDEVHRKICSHSLAVSTVKADVLALLTTCFSVLTVAILSY